MDKDYYKRIYTQAASEAEDYHDSPDPVIKNKSAQILQIVISILDELHRGVPDAVEFAEEAESDVEKKLQEIRNMLCPTQRSP